ncbi:MULTISPECIES: LLM class flavin-dependent oxidoreductase [unclassified Microbacterium]|uniref:LLM class flavin-dependent oxidoreductase n=1 Tax=unclassified Microbacterium TaxID=2609290 RepID=UPI00214C4C9B|nr:MULTISPECIES: LLM class flavin-dependent oxidoreductase [unclassified Microbacterium]MCR2810631.1 LLM class flavin-dependent oxidoreductase [Microbacterium sp. zg.B185]WIM18168.1 LLM class flavin-dependent oxidoreductase [Microbacterium sp. zg-B185]
MTSIGFVLGSTLPPVLLPETSKALESAGFDSVWVSEDYFFTGGVSGAAVVLGATERIHVGIGLLPIYVRHPALSAMEAATLAGAYPHRFSLGFGSGVKFWLEQMGQPQSAPLGAMRETVGSVRALLEGETLTSEGRFTFDGVKLTFPPEFPPPIYIGATGPKMTALSGEIADGVLMSVLCTPEFVANSRRVIDAAATAAGRGHTKITAFAVFSLADTVEEARAAARPVVADYLSLGSGELSKAAGISDELDAILAAGGREKLLAEMPDSWIDRVSICGDGPTALAAIEALGAAGADEVALMPVESHDLVGQVERAGRMLGLSHRN